MYNNCDNKSDDQISSVVVTIADSRLSDVRERLAPRLPHAPEITRETRRKQSRPRLRPHACAKMTGKYARHCVFTAWRIVKVPLYYMYIPTCPRCRSSLPSDSRDHRPTMTVGHALHTRCMPASRSHLTAQQLRATTRYNDAEQPCYGRIAIIVLHTLASHLLDSIFSTNSIPRAAPPSNLTCPNY